MLYFLKLSVGTGLCTNIVHFERSVGSVVANRSGLEVMTVFSG